MTVKQYLSQIKYLNMRVDRKLDELELLKNETTNITTRLNPNKVQSTPKHDKLAEQVAKMVVLEREINADIDNYYEAKQTIIKQIESLDKPIYYHILHLKYVQGKTNKETAEKLGYSLRQIMNLYGEALINFSEKYEKDIKEF